MITWHKALFHMVITPLDVIFRVQQKFYIDNEITLNIPTFPKGSCIVFREAPKIDSFFFLFFFFFYRHLDALETRASIKVT